MLLLPEVDHDRREQVCDWLQSHGIQPRQIPIDTPLTATPIAEGRLAVEFTEYVLDDAGKPVIDTNSYLLRPERTRVVVDTTPPGYAPSRSLTWDGYAWIRHLEETDER